MLTLKNLDCNHLQISSEYLDDVYQNPCDYSKIEISAKINCCDTIYNDTINLPASGSCLPDVWSFKLPVLPTLLIQRIGFRNIFTGTEVPISYTVNISSVTSFNNIDNVLTVFFQNNFNSGIATLNGAATLADGIYTYLLEDIPSGFIPTYVEYSDGVVNRQIPFTFTGSVKDSFIYSEGLLVSPKMFGKAKFADGIYSLTITAYKTSGTRVTETNCLFVDCSLSCEISKKLKTLGDKERVELLMIHYALTQGTNCPCDCDLLCELYRQLNNKLEINPQISGCGC